MMVRIGASCTASGRPSHTEANFSGPTWTVPPATCTRSGTSSRRTSTSATGSHGWQASTGFWALARPENPANARRLVTLVLTAAGRREPRWLDWAISVAWAVGVCGAALLAHRGRVGTHSGWVEALWSAGLLVGAILPVYWTYKR